MSAELNLVEQYELTTPEPDVRILNCQPNNLLQWKAAEPYLAKALEHTDDWGLDDVMAQYCDSKVGIILCIADNKVFGALCCEVIHYPKKTVMQVHLFGADDHSEELWMSFIWPQLQDLSRSLGCASIMGTGRDGWVRKLQALRRYIWEVPI